MHQQGFNPTEDDLNKAFESFGKRMETAQNVTELLLIEAQLTKNLYKIAVNRTQQTDFIRQHDGIDDANAF